MGQVGGNKAEYKGREAVQLAVGSGDGALQNR
jgi:hypothetical protein